MCASYHYGQKSISARLRICHVSLFPHQFARSAISSSNLGSIPELYSAQESLGNDNGKRADVEMKSEKPWGAARVVVAT